MTNDPNPVISGTGEPGRIVVVSADVDTDPAAPLETIGEVVVAGDGKWSTESLLPLPGGIIDLSAAQTDISAAQILATETEVADRLGATVQGTIEISPLIAAASPVFDLTSLAITNNQTPEIRGRGGLGNTVVVFTDADADGVPDTVLNTTSVVGFIGNISVTDDGAGYTSAPTVTITGGGGAGATATATIDVDTGLLTGITIEDPGAGYTSVPTVTITGGGATSDATATAIIRFVESIAIDDGGAGYTSVPTVTITGGDATQDATATATIDVATGLLTGITIDDVGAGYKSVPTVTITGGGATSDATATAAINGTWSLTPIVSLDEGVFPLVAFEVDPAGNVSDSTFDSIEIDLTAPATPLFDSGNSLLNE